MDTTRGTQAHMLPDRSTETILIACKTLEDEIDQVFKDASSRIDVAWVKSGLHNTPSKLHDELQGMLDGVGAETRRVLLGFGNCGNAVQHLKAGNFELVIPRVDDCVSLFLGSNDRRTAVSRAYAGIYLTAGWMRGERNLVVEYNHMMKRYGPETTKRAISAAYGNYHSLCLLNTGAYDVDALSEQAVEVANVLGLKQVVVQATTAYLADLITGPWDDVKRFVTVPPHGEVDPSEFFAGA